MKLTSYLTNGCTIARFAELANKQFNDDSSTRVASLRADYALRQGVDLVSAGQDGHKQRNMILDCSAAVRCSLRQGHPVRLRSGILNQHCVIRRQEALQGFDGGERLTRGPLQQRIHCSMVNQKPSDVPDFHEARVTLPKLAFDEEGRR